MNASVESRYELADFHPENGHRHHCPDPTSCDCAAWLYALAIEMRNPVPTGWVVVRRDVFDRAYPERASNDGADDAAN